MTHKFDDTYVEYVEILNLTLPYSIVTVDIAMVDGKCVKTVTSISDYRIQREA
jgi:hypothetical protein